VTKENMFLCYFQQKSSFLSKIDSQSFFSLGISSTLIFLLTLTTIFSPKLTRCQLIKHFSHINNNHSK